MQMPTFTFPCSSCGCTFPSLLRQPGDHLLLLDGDLGDVLRGAFDEPEARRQRLAVRALPLGHAGCADAASRRAHNHVEMRLPRHRDKDQYCSAAFVVIVDC